MRERDTVRPDQAQVLFPCMDTLNEALAYAGAQVPITDPNQLHSLLMTYHNTLLKAQENAKFAEQSEWGWLP